METSKRYYFKATPRKVIPRTFLRVAFLIKLIIMKNEFIKMWAEAALTKTKCINQRASSSYGLKHYCEESIGEYVSNQEMIDVLTELGFNKKRYVGPNYVFNISKIINKVVFKNRLGRMYNNTSRIYNPRSKTIEI